MVCEQCQGRGEDHEEISFESFNLQTRELAMVYPAYRRHGQLPEPGSFLQQPATFIDAVNLLEGYIERELEEQRKEHERNQRTRL